MNVDHTYCCQIKQLYAEKKRLSTDAAFREYLAGLDPEWQGAGNLVMQTTDQRKQSSKKAQSTKAADRTRNRRDAVQRADILTEVTYKGLSDKGLSATVPASFNRNANQCCEAGLCHKDDPLFQALGVSQIRFQFKFKYS